MRGHRRADPARLDEDDLDVRGRQSQSQPRNKCRETCFGTSINIVTPAAAVSRDGSDDCENTGPLILKDLAELHQK